MNQSTKWKRIIGVIALLLLVAISVGCKENENVEENRENLENGSATAAIGTEGDTRWVFYSKSSTRVYPFYVYIDGNYHGQIKVQSYSYRYCNDTEQSIDSGYLSVKLKKGDHTFRVNDKNGTKVSSGSISVTEGECQAKRVGGF